MLVVTPAEHWTCLRQRFVHAVVPQRFALQLSPVGHAGQVMVFPQPSVAVPHWKPWAAQVFGVQTMLHRFAETTPQLSPTGQVPQSMAVPQPFVAAPHWKPCAAQVFGVHTTPHTFGVVAPQV
jgi:hypothetical protein